MRNNPYLKLEVFLDSAWDAHLAEKHFIAFEQLHNAVKELAMHIKRVDSTVYRANNTASCLANGIQPD